MSTPAWYEKPARIANEAALLMRSWRNRSMRKHQIKMHSCLSSAHFNSLEGPSTFKHPHQQHYIYFRSIPRTYLPQISGHNLLYFSQWLKEEVLTVYVKILLKNECTTLAISSCGKHRWAKDWTSQLPKKLTLHIKTIKIIQSWN